MLKAKKAPPVNNPLKAQKAPTTARGNKTGKAIAGRTGGGMKLPTKKVRPPMPTDTGGRVMPKKRRPKVSDTGFGLRRPKIPVGGRKKSGSMMDRLVNPRRKTTSPTKRKAIPVRRQGSPLMGLGRMARGQRRR
jgi:hypothetical protein